MAGFGYTYSRLIRYSLAESGFYITSQSEINVPEDQTAITTVIASEDSIFSFDGGTDDSLCNLNSLSGLLELKALQDYEFPVHVGNTLTIKIKAQTLDYSKTAYQTITIHITDVEEVALPAGYYSILSGAPELNSGVYKIPDISGNGNHAQIVQSNAVKFNNNAAIFPLPNICKVVSGVGAAVNTYIFDYLIRIDDLSQVNKYIILNNVSTSQGFRVLVNSNKFKVQCKDNFGNPEQTFETVCTIPDNTSYYSLQITVIKGASTNASVNRIKVDYNGNTQEVFDISATPGPINPTAGMALGSTSGAAKMSIAYYSATINGVKECEFTMAENAMYGAIFDQYDSVSGNTSEVRNVTLIKDNDLLPSNAINGFQLFVQILTPFNRRYVPYKSDGTRMFTSPTSEINAQIAGYMWMGDYPPGSSLNFCESSLLVDGTIVSLDELTDMSIGKYFAKIVDNTITKIVTYTTEQTGQDVLDILSNLSINPTILNTTIIVFNGTTIDYSLLAQINAGSVKVDYGDDTTIYLPRINPIFPMVDTGYIFSNDLTHTYADSGEHIITVYNSRAINYIKFIDKDVSGDLTNLKNLKAIRVTLACAFSGDISGNENLYDIYIFASQCSITGDIGANVNLTRVWTSGSFDCSIYGDITNLTKIEMTYVEPATSFYGDVSKLIDAWYVILYGSNFMMGDLSLLTKPVIFNLSGNPMVTGSIAGWVDLEGLGINGTNSGAVKPTSFTTNPKFSSFRNDAAINNNWVWTESQVNQILADCWANKDITRTYLTTQRSIRLNTPGSSAPTGQGLIDKANLIAATPAWEILTN